MLAGLSVEGQGQSVQGNARNISPRPRHSRLPFSVLKTRSSSRSNIHAFYCMSM